MRAGAAALVAALTLAGCSGEDERAADAPATEQRAGEPRGAAAVRGWIEALNTEDYGRAASYFAPGVIVDQGRALRLRTRAAAISFNRSLPCKADVTDIERDGATVLAAFRLRAGPGGCRAGGAARVRFRFTPDGRRFTLWRQLPAEAEPGVVA